MAEKRHIIKRGGRLVGNGLDALLQKAENRGVEGSLKDAAREQNADARTLRADAIQAAADLKSKERRAAEIEEQLEQLFTQSDQAREQGNGVAMGEIADDVERLSGEYQDIQNELDELRDSAEVARNDLAEQIETARRFQQEAARRARDHERNKREEARLKRQLGLTESDDVTGRNLQKALEETTDTKDRVAALREARRDPLFQKGGDRLSLEDDVAARIRARNNKLGGGGDPEDRLARAARKILEARGGGSQRALESDEDEAPAAPPAGEREAAKPAADSKDAAAPAADQPKPAAPERDGL